MAQHDQFPDHPPSPIPQPRDPFSALLVEIINVSNQLRKTNASLHEFQDGFPPGGTLLLQMLAQRGPMTVPQLARARFTSRQNIQMTVNRLRSGGWVQTEGNPAHKRSDLVRITPQGQWVLAEANRREENLRGELGMQFRTEETAQVGELLVRIRQSLAAIQIHPHRLEPPNSTSHPAPPGALPREDQLVAANVANELPVSLL